MKWVWWDLFIRSFFGFFWIGRKRRKEEEENEFWIDEVKEKCKKERKKRMLEGVKLIGVGVVIIVLVGVVIGIGNVFSFLIYFVVWNLLLVK